MEPYGHPYSFEAELILEGVRMAIGLHLQACELLIKAIMEERMEDCEEVLSLAAAGDTVGDLADQEAESYRTDLGVLG